MYRIGNNEKYSMIFHVKDDSIHHQGNRGDLFTVVSAKRRETGVSADPHVPSQLGSLIDGNKKVQVPNLRYDKKIIITRSTEVQDMQSLYKCRDIA